MALVQAVNLTIGYSKELLKNIDIVFGKEPKLIALLGVNGVGKTALLRTFAGILKPLDGYLFVDGKNINEITRKFLSQKITYTNNFFASKMLSVSDLLQLALLPYSNFWSYKIDTERLVKIVRLFDIEKLLHRQISTLSDGQKQMVNLARVFLQDTDIILLDEPFNFLDLEKSLFLLNIMKQFVQKGKTIIFSTHQIRNALLYSDLLWIIRNNRLLTGLPEVLALRGVFDTFFSTQNIKFNFKDLDFVLSDKKNFKKIFLKSKTDYLTEFWTKQMLKRIGFRIVKQQDQECKLFIYAKQWRLETKNKIFSFFSLEELYNTLKHCL